MKIKSYQKIATVILFAVSLFFLAGCLDGDNETTSSTVVYYEKGDGNPSAAALMNVVFRRQQKGLDEKVISSESLTYKKDGLGGYGIITVACLSKPGSGPETSKPLVSFAKETYKNQRNTWVIARSPNRVLSASIEKKSYGDQAITDKEELEIIKTLGNRLVQKVDATCK